MWKEGDILSCLLDLDSQTMCEFLEGRGLGGEGWAIQLREKGREKKHGGSVGQKTIGILDERTSQFLFNERQLVNGHRRISQVVLNVVIMAKPMLDTLLSNVETQIYLYV